MDFIELNAKLHLMNQVVIVGAGDRGERVVRRLLHKRIKVAYFFDNNRLLKGKHFYGIPIVFPFKLKNEEAYYIITTVGENQKQQYEQLLDLGISKTQIVLINDVFYDEYRYHESLRPDEYKDAISDLFYYRYGREMNWEKPTTYNEIINWEKINDATPLKTRLADKYLVKEWVKDKIGEKYVAKLYGVWDHPEDIDFDSLPDQFVLKVNHSSDMVIVVKNKEELDREEAVKKLAEWLDYDLSLLVLERHYASIPRKVICEEYMPSVAETAYDYKVYCFHGDAKYIECISECNTPRQKAAFYSPEWEKQLFSFAYPLDEKLAPCPLNLDSMLTFSNLLSEEFSHVRVDWYDLPDGRLMFGEMTFSSWGGTFQFRPEKVDEEWGNLIRSGK